MPRRHSRIPQPPQRQQQQQQQQMNSDSGSGGGGGAGGGGGGGRNFIFNDLPGPVEVVEVSYNNNGNANDHLPYMDTKHIRLPELERESSLLFELIILLHVIMLKGLQFLHLYKTVWWLPQSFVGSGVNLHLIDLNVVVFILIVTGRRVPYLIMKQIISENQVAYSVLRIVMSCTAATWLLVIIIRLWDTNSNVELIHLVYLFFMFPVYFYVFGMKLTPIWEIEVLDDPTLETASGYHHICTRDPVSIREECEMLRQEFNERLKGVLTLSIFYAYYTAFIPLSFVQPYVSFDFFWAVQHILLTWMYFLGLLVCRAFCPDFSDGLHKVANHLGYWQKVSKLNVIGRVDVWSADHLFLPGAIVKHQQKFYKTDSVTAAEPGNSAHRRFQLLFSSSTFSRLLLGFQLAKLLLAFLILMRSQEWYQVISLGVIILIIGSHTFIRASRDFFVVSNLYETEEIIISQTATK